MNNKKITKALSIYVLCLEDDLKDAELLKEMLHDSGYLVRMDIVSQEEQFSTSLKANNYDIILADYTLPGFDAPAALKQATLLRPDIPFICISGTIGEDTAVELLKQGATDYVLKDRIGRLAFAVQRALEESETKKEWKKAQAELKEKDDEIKESEVRYKYMFDNNPQPMWIYDLDTLKFLEVNHAAVEHYGYSREEFLSMTLKDIRPEEDVDALLKDIELTRKMYNSAAEWRHLKKNGELMYVEAVSYSIVYGKIEARHVMVTDITNRKLAEEALQESEEQLKAIFENSLNPIVIADDAGNYLKVNQAAAKMFQYPVEQLLQMNVGDLRTSTLPDAAARYKTYISKGVDIGEFYIIQPDGSETITQYNAVRVRENFNLSILSDITKSKKAEEALRLSENHSAFLAQTAFELVELTSIQEIYKYTVQKLYDLFEGNSIVALVEYNYSENHWKMQQITGAGKKAAQLSRLLGFDINNMEGDISTKYYEQITSGKVKELDFDFPDLFNNKLSTAIGSAVKKMFSIEKMYCIAYQQDEQIMGNITFTTNKKSQPINTKLIEAFIQQVSNFAKKQKAEEALHQSEARFRNIFEIASLGIVQVDPSDGKIILVNTYFATITGYPIDELLKMTFVELTHPDDREKDWEIFSKAARGEVEYRNEKRYVKKDGTIVWVRIHLAFIRDNKGKPIRTVAISEDITERKQAERGLQELEIARTTARFKQNFLANMSHEIRTPLTGVLGMIDILEQSGLSATQLDYVNTLKISGETLKEIINQVLDYSKIEAGKVSLKPVVFDFKSLIGDAILVFKNTTRQGVKLISRLDPEIPAFILADRNRLSQVINNLVSNALKFTHQGSVLINTQLLKKPELTTGLMIKVVITDTGIGIPAHLQAKLFNPFSQVDDKDSRFYEGTGLGLSISKALVGLLGGEIGFESHEKRGSSFWFTFLAFTVPEGRKLQLGKENKSQFKESLRILYAEDKAINQKVVSLMLKALGHEITIASNGNQALGVYNPGEFDLILMDIQMPVMDGVTATQRLKAKYKDLPPVVGLSANAFEGDREKYMAMGLDEYLTKPVKQEDFEKILQHFFASEMEDGKD